MLFSLSQIKQRVSSPTKRRRKQVSERIEHQRGILARRLAFLRIRVRLRRLGRRLLRIPLVALAYRTAMEMSADDATHMAAGVAYYAVLSLFPLTIGMISFLSLLLPPETLEGDAFTFFETYLLVPRELLDANINSPGGIQGFVGVISFLSLFWTASLMFGAITRSVNRAWDIHKDRPFYIDKARNIIMAFSIAPLFLLSVFSTVALQTLAGLELPVIGGIDALNSLLVAALSRILPFIFSLTIFLLIYKFIPYTTTYWRYIWPGALLASVLFEVSKSVFVFYVDNFANFEEIYGSLASIIVLMAWTYFSGLILITGAEFTSEYERMKLGVERGQVIIRRRTRTPQGDSPEE